MRHPLIAQQIVVKNQIDLEKQHREEHVVESKELVDFRHHNFMKKHIKTKLTYDFKILF